VRRRGADGSVDGGTVGEGRGVGTLVRIGSDELFEREEVGGGDCEVENSVRKGGMEGGKRRTVGELSDELAVEDGLNLNLTGEIELSVGLSLLSCEA
jgi:hypothetical protein